MALGGLLLGIINIAIVAAILVLIGAVIVMFAGWLSYPIDWNVQRLYLLVVLLVVLYMFVALLLGMPTIRIVGHHTAMAV
jgi:hypothetical protein